MVAATYPAGTTLTYYPLGAARDSFAILHRPPFAEAVAP